MKAGTLKRAENLARAHGKQEARRRSWKRRNRRKAALDMLGRAWLGIIIMPVGPYCDGDVTTNQA